jgi:hypothetical protein
VIVVELGGDDHGSIPHKRKTHEFSVINEIHVFSIIKENT